MNQCKEFGSRLLQARLNAGMSQKELAEAAEVSSQAVSAYEKQKQKPSIEVAAALAEKLGVSLDYLCGIEKKESPAPRIVNYADAVRHIAELAMYFSCTCEVVERPLPEEVWEHVQVDYDEWEEITTYEETVISIDDHFITGFLRRWSEIFPLYCKGIISKELMDNWYTGEIKRLEQIETASDTPKQVRWFGIDPVQKSQHKK